MSSVSIRNHVGGCHCTGLCSGLLKGVTPGLLEQVLEVGDADLIVAAHGGHGALDARQGLFAAALFQLLGGAADQSLHTAEVAVDIGVEEFDDQRVQRGVDEAGLRQQLLRGALVLSLRGRREVLGDADAAAAAMPVAGVVNNAPLCPQISFSGCPRPRS